MCSNKDHSLIYSCDKLVHGDFQKQCNQINKIKNCRHETLDIASVAHTYLKYSHDINDVKAI